MSSQLMDEIWRYAEESWQAYEGDPIGDFKYLTQDVKDKWFKVGTKIYEEKYSANV